MKYYALDDLIRFYTEILIRKGVSRDRAERIARVQVEIHAFGVTTHGLPPLNTLIDEIGNRRDVSAVPEVKYQSGSLFRADCSRTLSIENIAYGVKKAEEIAHDQGIGYVSLSDTGWVGALGYHLAESARKGYLLCIWVHAPNYLSVAPFGGRERRLPTNPMAFSFPLPGEEPFVADFSTSAISNGRWVKMREKNEHSAEPLFIGTDGKPSCDPQAAGNPGAILPAGGAFYGYKGTALSLWIEALSAVSGYQISSGKGEGKQNVHVIALKIGAMAGSDVSGEFGNKQGKEIPPDLDRYYRLMEELTGFVLSSKPAEGFEGPKLSGSRGWKALAEAGIRGISLPEPLVEKMANLSGAYSVSVPRANNG